MKWPDLQDYFEAIQTPRFCFTDPVLQSGTPELTRLGLPKAISGNFASVYQINCGARRWAVRCFVKEIPDQERRYSAISDHLQARKLPFIVGFKFIADGIRVAGRSYPILKMEWIDGLPLDMYVRSNLHQPAVLQDLAKQWLCLLSSLRGASIAHGDLQHGNIIVSHGQIKLIDYDGMFVPALAGWQSHEEGHRNYQHPARTSRDFGPHLDAFSGWVILASLGALAIEPCLWELTNAGDECLLFRREDFENPGQSRAFQEILSSRSVELQSLARKFKSLLDCPLSKFPPADSAGPVLSASADLGARSTNRMWRRSSSTRTRSRGLSATMVDPALLPTHSGSLPDWLKAESGQRPRLPSIPNGTVSNAHDNGLPSWFWRLVISGGSVPILLICFMLFTSWSSRSSVVPMLSQSSQAEQEASNLFVRKSHLGQSHFGFLAIAGFAPAIFFAMALWKNFLQLDVWTVALAATTFLCVGFQTIVSILALGDALDDAGKWWYGAFPLQAILNGVFLTIGFDWKTAIRTATLK